MEDPGGALRRQHKAGTAQVGPGDFPSVITVGEKSLWTSPPRKLLSPLGAPGPASPARVLLWEDSAEGGVSCPLHQAPLHTMTAVPSAGPAPATHSKSIATAACPAQAPVPGVGTGSEIGENFLPGFCKWLGC